MRQRRLLILVLAFLGLVAASALATPRDAGLKKAVDEAIATHYLGTQFDRAEAMIVDEITSCGTKCSPSMIAKAWMYVGIVRGSGKNDQPGAKEAFATALAYDPNVALDEGLATPQTVKTFAAAKKKGGGKKPTSKPPPGGGGKMQCSLTVSEVQTRRPIPIACTSVEEATKLELRYDVGDDKWQRIKMKKRDGGFQATIPCTATKSPGSLRVYVRAQDSEGNAVDSLGSKSEPVEIELVKETEEEAPAFPDDEAPKRCSKSAAKAGAGDDEEAQECESTEDCSDGKQCLEGTCQEGEKKKKKNTGPFKENWVGLHLAYDFAIVGGSDVCSQASQRDNGFACFYEGTEDQYLFNAQPKVANNINTGLAPATYRAMLSFDRVFGENVTGGIRLGYAFGGGPPSGEDKEVKFLPYHIELRGSYWFGERPFAEEGLRPYVGVSAGAAQVDAKLPVTVGDCGGVPDGAPSSPGATLVKDQAFSAECAKGPTSQRAPALALDAYKKLGKGFGGLHVGAVYALGKDSGVQLNLNFLYFVPTSGQVIEPSLGYVIGL